jgi:hypothetical protein
MNLNAQLRGMFSCWAFLLVALLNRREVADRYPGIPSSVVDIVSHPGVQFCDLIGVAVEQ